MKRILLLLLLQTFIFTTNAQLSTREAPISFNHKITGKRSIATVTMPYLDMKKVEEEDKEDEEWGMPPRFGYLRQVNYNLNNSGTWTKLSNGDKLWRLKVICPGALSVNFLYDKFWLPEGGKFFVYSADKKHHIGAFTSQNNKGDRDNLRGFATGLVYGSEVVLEYYQPKEVFDDAIISISFVVHGYRFIRVGDRGYGDSDRCQVSVNCSEGQNWQNEKKAVALILVDGCRLCTGSLINNTANDQKPYLLTANHCLTGSPNHTTHDAEGDSILDYYSFYWNYESPCGYSSNEPDSLKTEGAIVIANNYESDFALLRLTEDPKILSGYTPYYLGWDCSGNSGDPGVCIHHPAGDAKKISTVASQPYTGPYGYQNLNNYWKVLWATTANGHGFTEGGSSGSALLNATHKVIGQLHGGDSGYDEEHQNTPDNYGKFDVSWMAHDTCGIHRRLDCWLDSIGTGQLAIEGLQIIEGRKTWTEDMELYCNIRVISGAVFSVKGHLQMKGSSTIIVESGGRLTVNGGTISNVNIDLKVGSTLKIVNNGKIETQNGFVAPVGAEVIINYGQIL